jgi:ribonuclease HII
MEQRVAGPAGLTYVAGLDEAGRGALAGPVVAAAVILPLDRPELLVHLAGVDDSKKLTAAERAALYEVIVEHALCFAIGSASAEEIDEVGIIGANIRAMRAAIAALDPGPQFLLVDGPLAIKGTALPQQAIVRGDSSCLTIAAASILAKVSRDRQMIALAGQYPDYGFERHKGYATVAHREAIARFGPAPIHRRTFAPFRERLL